MKNIFKKDRIKINIPDKTFIINLVGLAIFVTLICIYFIFKLGNIYKVSGIKSKDYESYSMTAKLEAWSQLITDGIFLILFLVLLVLGRARIEYGLIFGWIWMTIFLFISILPFVLQSKNLVWNIVMIIPTIFIYIGQFIFLNELSWDRKRDVEMKRRMKYLV